MHRAEKLRGGRTRKKLTEMGDITLQCLHLRAKAASRLFLAIVRVFRGSGLRCAGTSATGRSSRRSASSAADDAPHSAPLALGRARAFDLFARRHVRLRQPHARTHQTAVKSAGGGWRRGGGGGSRRPCPLSAGGGSTLEPSAHTRRFPRGRRRSLLRRWFHATHTTWHDAFTRSRRANQKTIYTTHVLLMRLSTPQ